METPIFGCNRFSFYRPSPIQATDEMILSASTASNTRCIKPVATVLEAVLLYKNYMINYFYDQIDCSFCTSFVDCSFSHVLAQNNGAICGRKVCKIGSGFFSNAPLLTFGEGQFRETEWCGILLFISFSLILN